MSDESVLVTGGAGYIGSHICKALKEAGYEPITLDNLCNGEENRVQFGPFINGSIFDHNLIKQTLEKHLPFALIHMAAHANVRESVLNPGKYYNNNVFGTRALMKAIENSSIRTCIFSSSCSVYGIPETCPVTEETLTHPITPYGESKLLAEKVMQNQDKTCGILRYFNASGSDPEGQIGENVFNSPRIISNVIKSLLKDEPLKLYGDGTIIRDFIHVTDLADAHVKMLSLQENHTFNLGTGRGHTLLEIIEGLETLAGKKVKIENCAPNPGDPPTLFTSCEKAKEILNWEPKYSDLPTILKTAWDFACSQN